MMKFLVITEPRVNIGLQEAVGLFQAAREWVDAKIREGRIEYFYGLRSGGGVGVLSADSYEECMDQIAESPLFPLNTWEVRPLVDLPQLWLS